MQDAFHSIGPESNRDRVYPQLRLRKNGYFKYHPSKPPDGAKKLAQIREMPLGIQEGIDTAKIVAVNHAA
jgi:hypothetical protein